MNTTIKTITCGIILAFSTTQSLTASTASTGDTKITIEEMEISLAKLAKEIAEEKTKIYQKEIVLHDMEVALLKEKHNKTK